MEKIIVHQLEKQYEQFRVGPCSFCVSEGQTLAVMGPSGCGKSTLLKGIAGLIETSGSITINNLKRLVMVFDEACLLDVMNVAENITLGMKKEGYAEDEIKVRLNEIACSLEISDQLNKMPHELSNGQRQRAALARALIRDFDVLLMDEPFSGLDVLLRKQLLKMLKDMQKEKGFTCVYVTHDVSDAKIFSDQVLILHDGKMEMLGSVQACEVHPVSDFVRALFD